LILKRAESAFPEHQTNSPLFMPDPEPLTPNPRTTGDRADQPI
jgi:hypothetical protein